MMESFDFPVQINGLDEWINHDLDFKEFCDFSNGHMEDHEITPYDYQLETAFNFLKFKFASAELATSAGKTLVAWLFYRKFKELHPDGKLLMIVPTVDLVSQAEHDFHDYNMRQTHLKIQEIYSAAKEIRGEPDITISTYQSLVNKDPEFFNDFTAVIVDECHKAKIKSILAIFKNLQHTQYRIGFSGTLPKTTSLDYLTLLELTGPTVNKVKVKDLEAKNRSTPVDITVLRLKYLPKKIKKSLYENYKHGDKKLTYSKEVEIVRNSQKRRNFIARLVGKPSKNTLVLFKHIDFGTELFKTIQEMYPDKEVFYIDGSVDSDKERKVIIKEMKEGEDKILVASFQTFSTGISIKNIHNIFLTESYKSEFVIRQTIGRGIRLHKNKKKVNVIDIVDDFRYKYTDGKGKKKTWMNYLYRQMMDRIKIYKQEEFPYSFKSKTLG